MCKLWWMITACLVWQCHGAPLDDYIAKPETITDYESINVFHDDDLAVTVYVYKVTTLEWFDETFSSWPVWWHYMSIVIPDVVLEPSSGFYFISEYINTDPPPTPDSDYFLPFIMEFCNRTGAPGVLLDQIPNGPISFPFDPTGENRTSDNLIAYTWKIYMEFIEDPEVVLLFPMTKSAIISMNVAEEILADLFSINTNRWLVAGASKRGWTSWLVAATQSARVMAVGPMVFSLLKMQDNLNRHFQSYGGWSWAFEPYWRENITQYLTDAKTQTMMALTDPFEFNNRLTMPKMLISATGDEFFRPDETNIFWDELMEPKYLLMLENATHVMIGHHSRLLNNFVNFWRAVHTSSPLPAVSWTRELLEDQGRIDLVTDVEPLFIRAYTAFTTNITDIRNDFRRLVGADPSPNRCFWYEDDVQDLGGLRYRAHYNLPEEGWFGFFISGTWPGPTEGATIDFTSDLQILPGGFPYPPCTGWDCYGQLT